MVKFDEIISLGSQCDPALTLKILNLKNKTYPFDWVRSNSKIIFDVLLNGKTNYITFNSEKNNEYYTKSIDEVDFKDFPETHINLYGQYFAHYINISTNDLIDKFNNYFERFYSVLNDNKKILFIHTHEEYIYHKKSRDDKDMFYDYLCKINDLLEKNYPTLDFTILNIDINNMYKNHGKIINMSIEYNMKISDNCETHKGEFFHPYRHKITDTVIKYLRS